jgi:hypothetical protein
MLKRRVILAVSTVTFAVAMFSGTALANNSQNSAIECGGTGSNNGQALRLIGINGPGTSLTPPEFAALLGAASVGKLIQRDCVIAK